MNIGTVSRQRWWKTWETGQSVWAASYYLGAILNCIKNKTFQCDHALRFKVISIVTKLKVCVKLSFGPYSHSECAGTTVCSLVSVGPLHMYTTGMSRPMAMYMESQETIFCLEAEVVAWWCCQGIGFGYRRSKEVEITAEITAEISRGRLVVLKGLENFLEKDLFVSSPERRNEKAEQLKFWPDMVGLSVDNQTSIIKFYMQPCGDILETQQKACGQSLTAIMPSWTETGLELKWKDRLWQKCVCLWKWPCAYTCMCLFVLMMTKTYVYMSEWKGATTETFSLARVTVTLCIFMFSEYSVTKPSVSLLNHCVCSRQMRYQK